ncbi:MAG: hypothetical protein ACC657_16730, partial [Thiohalomonadales bacterium]
YYRGERLDEKQYVQMAGGDKKLILGSLAFVLFGFGFIFLMVWVVTDYNSIDFNDFYYMIILFSISIPLGLYAIFSKTKKFLIFDREHGMVYQPKGLFKSEIISDKWEHWGARLQLSADSEGVSMHRLWLYNYKTMSGSELDTSTAGIDKVLAYWSFIVQYMEPGGLLPAARPFENMEHTDGVGGWQRWESDKIHLDFLDPYYRWLGELKADPFLDPAK